MFRIKKDISWPNFLSRYPIICYPFEWMAFILALYYSAINALSVEISMQAGFDFKFLGYKLTTIFWILLINIAAIRIYISGVQFSGLQKSLAFFLVVFTFLSIQHDFEWILKDVLYLLFIILPSTIISIACINCLISSQRYFIRLNVTTLAAICALLIVFTPANIELRASLPHLNANTYSTFGAYLLLATVTYPSTKLWRYFISLGCILLALAVLSYANSVGITLILLSTLIFALFSRLNKQTKGLILLSIFMVIATIFFSKYINKIYLPKFNQQEITISDRAITLVTNTSSTMYDRLEVYKYVVQNFWDHFFIGSYYYLPGIHTAHNVVIEIFLISGFFGAALFCYLTFISSLRWLSALTKGNEAINFIALLYFFSLVEALFRGRLVYSVLLVVLMAASFDRSFAKFINEKKKNYNEPC
jgi:hypothetical protein